MMTTPPFPPECPREPSRQDPRGGPAPHGHIEPNVAELLLDRRIVLADKHLDSACATKLSARLMMLDAAGEDPVALHLCTPDGDLEAAIAVADTVGVLACPVQLLVSGQVGGAVLAVLAAARRRLMTPLATLRLTEPRARFGGEADETAAFEAEHRRSVDAFYRRLAEVTGHEVDEIRHDARQGRLLTAEEAFAYGLVHDIVSSAPPQGSAAGCLPRASIGPRWRSLSP
jgi:ATP-dependent Clp protease, protease subunit